MAEQLVTVVDMAKARFLSLEPRSIPEIESGPNLVEGKAFVNPEAEQRDGAVFSDSKSGRNRPRQSGSGAGHGYDDHRQEHHREVEKHFAEKVMGEASRRAVAIGAKKIILTSNPRMLGYLRPFASSAAKIHAFKIVEHESDLANLVPQAIHRYLAEKNLIPAKKPPEKG